MKTLFVVMLISALLVGCGPSAQEKKANSPECLAAKNQAAEDKAKAASLDAEIRARDKTKRMELENLRLDDKSQQRIEMTELLHRIATAKSPLLLYLFPLSGQQRRKLGVLSRSSLSAQKRFVLTKTRKGRRR